jgi:uncharacterized membrane protein YgcG
MRQKIGITVLVVALAVVGFTPRLLTAQVPLDDQLKAQYNMVKMGADSSGTAVVEAGTLLAVKKGGILGVPYSDASFTPTKYQDGQVHSPNAIMQKGIGSFMKKIGREQNTHFFQVGDKVYPSHIDVNMAKDSVTMGIIECDQCNNTNPPTYYKADVVFQFAKGQLAKMSAPQVEDTIAALLAIDEGGDQGQGGNDQQGGNQGGGGGNGGGGNGGGGGQQAQQQAPPPEPQQIEKGQTPAQVKAALGPPEKIVNLGAKQLYVYHDIKVTFVNGKVSDVQ